MSSAIQEYIYVNREQINGYAEQIKSSTVTEKKFSWKLSVSLMGPSVDAGQEISKRPSNVYEKIEQVTRFLKDNELVDYSRPTLYKDFHNGKPFILESFFARKIIIPHEYLSPVKNLQSFAVWVSEPEISAQETNINFRATHLYLTESYWDYDDENPSSPWSGFSALQAIANIVSGKPIFGEHHNWQDAQFWTYLNPEHPITKLMRIGGYISDSRKITSLYRKRYFSNEQSFVKDKQNFRINDLLGYPVFIASVS